MDRTFMFNENMVMGIFCPGSGPIYMYVFVTLYIGKYYRRIVYSLPKVHPGHKGMFRNCYTIR